MRLIKNYDYIIDYHPRKANDVTDALSLKNKFVMDESMDWNKKEWVELKKNDARFEVGLVRSLLVQLKV